MYYIIINPASRSGKGLKIWKTQIEPALQKEQVSYRHYISEKPGDVIRIAKELSEAAGETAPLRIIVLGGDGTINETLQGIQNPARLLLGYVPTGSSNDLARDLKLPQNPIDALRLILRSENPIPMDLGRVTCSDGQIRLFAGSCGMGYDAAVCEQILHSSMKKNLNRIGLGKLVYLNVALKQLVHAKTVSGKLTLDNNVPIPVRNMLFTCFMVHRFEGGGFLFAPDADAHDGILNLCAVGDIPKVRLLCALPSAFKGKHFRFQGITPYQAKEVILESDTPLWIHTDGEVLRKDSRVTVSCEKDAFSMLL